MTTTTNTLTRWLPLWEQDESLRPVVLSAFTPADQTLWQLEYGEYYSQTIPELIAAALIRDAAVRWLVIAWANLKITNEALLDAITSGFLDDALYEACKAVLAGDTT